MPNAQMMQDALTIGPREEVEHLRLCAGWGLGEGDISRIDVRGADLGRFTERIPPPCLNIQSK